jgi:hypothetical protein
MLQGRLAASVGGFGRSRKNFTESATLGEWQPAKPFVHSRFMSEADGEIGVGQSALYLSVALAYRNAYLANACESDCWLAAIKAVQCIHPFLLNKEAEKLARRIVSQFSERFPEWLAR